MKTLVILVFCVAIPIWGQAQESFNAAHSNNQFAFDLYRAFTSQEGNLLLSPFSVSSVLAMTYAGAKGETASQMADVLHFENSEAIHGDFSRLIVKLTENEANDMRLHLANAIWIQRDAALNKMYTDRIIGEYRAEIQSLNFSGDPIASKDTINNWVKRKTQGKIEELLQQRHISRDTRLVLTNAIWFKAGWQKPFSTDFTREDTFWLGSDNQQVIVPIMKKDETVAYYENDSLQMALIPYSNGEASLLLLLPRTHDGLPALEAGLSNEVLDSWLNATRQNEVELYLPKFKTSGSFDMGVALTGLGMTDAFGGKADFSGMTGQKDLYISAVVHNTFMDLNETGTEAAGATAVVMTRKVSVLGREKQIVRADHPFVYMIRENSTGTILFMGRMSNPTL